MISPGSSAFSNVSIFPCNRQETVMDLSQLGKIRGSFDRIKGEIDFLGIEAHIRQAASRKTGKQAERLLKQG